MVHVLACKRMRVADCPARLPAKYLEALEQNQKIASCCRHPENHEIEAWYSSERERDKGVPDIYIFHCTCGRQHRRFCAGGDNPVTGERDRRPFWDMR